MLKKLFVKKQFPFKEPADCAIFTCCHIVNDKKPVLYINHDDDGDWQFLCGKIHEADEGRIISLNEIFEMDPSVGETSALKCGQTAVRDYKNGKWKLAKE